MKRDEALEKAQRAVNAQYPRSETMIAGLPITSGPLETVAILEALGLIKLQEPEPKAHFVPALSFEAKGNSPSRLHALIREDTLVETLRMVGYSVELLPYRWPAADAHQ